MSRTLSYLPLWSFVFLASMLFSGCYRRSPRGTAQRYVENLQQFNYAKCYSLLSTQDRAERPLYQFLTEIPLAPDVSPIWFRPILHAMHFELGDEHRNPDGVTAYVPVRITALDLPLWERTLDVNAGSAGSPGQLAHRSLAAGKYPTITYDDRIALVKEYHHWRVLAGFAARDLVLSRHRRAMLDFYEGRLNQVLAQFDSMISELEQLPGTGNLGLAAHLQTERAQISKVQTEMPAAARYGAKLKLDGVAMRMAGTRVPAIFGDITNTGDKPIDELSLAVTWYQGLAENFKVVQREEHSIVVTPIEFTDFSRQVIPFLPGERRQFGFILSAAPEVQQNATPYVTVAWLAFTQIPALLPKLNTSAISQAPHLAANPVRAAASPAATSAAPPSLAAARPEPGTLHSNHHN
ncbi:MAG: hypothetical protein JOZ29_19725 [Deltaproteobacteria bacterium]|nr:hypothetical protein [Deltaproteobacteria bacterium]MBV8454479.1 hypothetical protein [Deltaproteobacteria bacterium]